MRICYAPFESTITQQNIVVNRPICGTIFNASSLPNAKAFNSVSIQFNVNTPSNPLYLYDYHRFLATTSYQGNMLRKDTMEFYSASGNPSYSQWVINERYNRRQYALTPCKNYIINLQNECGVVENNGNIKWYVSQSNGTSTSTSTDCCRGLQSLSLVNKTTNSIKVTWNQITGAEARKYKVELMTTNNQVLQTFIENTTNANAQQLTKEFFNLLPSTAYKIKVTSICETTEWDGNNMPYQAQHEGINETLTIITYGLDCPAPSYIDIGDKTSTSFKVILGNPPSTYYNKYFVQLKDVYSTLLKEEVLNGTTPALETTFANLSPATNYRVDVYSRHFPALFLNCLFIFTFEHGRRISQ